MSGPRRALVTGGAGFIGSTLVDRLLAEGWTVDVVDDLSAGRLSNLAEARSSWARQIRFHQLDVRSPHLLELMVRRPPEVVFHLAAQTDPRVSLSMPVLDAEQNVVGSLQVLEAARAAGVSRVVFAASAAIYGNPPPAALPVVETAPQRPLSPYGVSKKAVLDYLAAYRELYDLEYCALVIANVYGPRQDPRNEGGVVAVFARRLSRGEPCVVHGDGAQTRDFVFVDDVVDAFVRAADAGGGLLVNVGTGVETPVLSLYREVAGAAGVAEAPRFVPPRPGDPLRSCLDPTRALVHLGWKPWTSLADGVAAVLEYFRARTAAEDGTGVAAAPAEVSPPTGPGSTVGTPGT